MHIIMLVECIINQDHQSLRLHRPSLKSKYMAGVLTARTVGKYQWEVCTLVWNDSGVGKVHAVLCDTNL